MKFALICCLISFAVISRARAFDPFTAAQGVQAANGILGGMEKLNDASDVGFAFSELLDELDVDQSSDAEVTEVVKRLEKLEGDSNELNSINQGSRELLNGRSIQRKSFGDKIRHLRSMIQMTKRLGAILGIKPKAASNAIQLQQSRISYMMLDELMAIRRTQYEQNLRDDEQRIAYEKALSKVMAEEKKQLKVSSRRSSVRSPR